MKKEPSPQGQGSFQFTPIQTTAAAEFLQIFDDLQEFRGCCLLFIPG